MTTVVERKIRSRCSVPSNQCARRERYKTCRRPMWCFQRKRALAAHEKTFTTDRWAAT